MLKHYRSLTKLGKVYIWLSTLILALFAFCYFSSVYEAINMDPASYNCLEDSMMKQICQDPWGSSIIWGILTALVYAWPLVLGWLVLGLAILLRKLWFRIYRSRKKPHSKK